MITGLKESKTLAKDISFKCKCKFDRRESNSDQWWNNDKCRCDCEKHHICEKDYVWNPATWNYENGKCLASVMDKDIFDETIVVEETNFNEKNVTCKTKNSYVLVAFSLITIILLIDVSVYCYVITYWTKHFLSFHNTNNKLNKCDIDTMNWKWVIKVIDLNIKNQYYQYKRFWSK